MKETVVVDMTVEKRSLRIRGLMKVGVARA